MFYKKLKDWGLSVTHRILLDERNVLRIQACVGGSDETPSVYVWASSRYDKVESIDQIEYVGKAGRGAKKRMRDHESGFRNSVTGRANAVALRKILNEGRYVFVLTRTSNTTSLFGENVSQYSTEEAALIEALQPALNRAEIPNARGTARAGKRRFDGLMALDSTLDADSLRDVIDSYSDDQYTILCELLDLVARHVVSEGVGAKLVRRYSSQPAGCSGFLTIVFAQLQNNRVVRNTSIAKIYLADIPRVAYRVRMMNSKSSKLVDIKNDWFSPRDTLDFLKNQKSYLCF